VPQEGIKGKEAEINQFGKQRNDGKVIKQDLKKVT